MVQTPKYWDKLKMFKEKVKVKTMYGNEVDIPKTFAHIWEAMEFGLKTDKNYPQAALDGAMKGYGKSFRSIGFTNLLMVFEEIFKEDRYSEWMLSADK